MNYYISDMHWGQKDIIEYDNRPFATEKKCYEFMKSKWNEIVGKNDHVYIIGDCFFENTENFDPYLHGLNGYLHLVIGNNDYKLVESDAINKYFVEIGTILKTVDNNRTIVMCHYPFACWEHKDKENCFHLFGHVHKNGNDEYYFMNQSGNACNAGCMINNYIPVTLDELIENNKKFYQK